ncbi:MAG: PQQ-binding-like beta-propeller repeat protein, partial [Gemmataceae bacterium]
NDVVVQGQVIFGLDEGILCCIDAQTGKRLWKGGRYGHGQLVLLPDAPVLLVLSERGQGVLVEADPDNERELAQQPFIEGKTWNHPVLVGNRLYVRNAERMACYELPGSMQ